MRYKNYNNILKGLFENRVQKVSINAGFTCPNRDGSKGRGGCTYCNNQSFVPGYSKTYKTITQQIDEGIVFFQKKEKYKDQAYLAYFQSYTNTYDSIDNLRKIYEEALEHPRVKGIVIGTRPDCVNDKILDYFADLSKQTYVMLEYGIESTNNKTLEFINRGHDYQSAIDAITATAQRDINTGAHLILGLPGENREIILGHAEKINQLPLTAIKLHQLQLIKGTIMARQAQQKPELFTFFTAEEYIELVIDFLERLSPGIAIERFVSQSPKELLLSPDWGLKNFEFVDKIEKRMIERDSWQGKKVLSGEF
ncbi:MAG: TIGR01212 family radical SAM protein [Bacteroidales bacterium 36-12]|jgi:radical SAM protein (TIGR01212 family)|nr:MAG: TIGR01212 family radical SAM protein [Bacteroidales bacterium 36-12]